MKIIDYIFNHRVKFGLMMKRIILIAFVLCTVSNIAAARSSLVIKCKTENAQTKVPPADKFISIISGQLPGYKFRLIEITDEKCSDTGRKKAADKLAEQYMVENVIFLFFEKESLSSVIFFAATGQSMSISVENQPGDPSAGLYSLAIKIKSALKERGAVENLNIEDIKTSGPEPMKPLEGDASLDDKPKIKPAMPDKSAQPPDKTEDIIKNMHMELSGFFGYGYTVGLNAFSPALYGELSFFPIQPIGVTLGGGGNMEIELKPEFDNNYETSGYQNNSSIYFQRFFINLGVSGRFDYEPFSFKWGILGVVERFRYDLTELKISEQVKYNPGIAASFGAKYYPFSWLFFEIKPVVTAYFRTQRIFNDSGCQLLGAPLLNISGFLGAGVQFF